MKESELKKIRAKVSRQLESMTELDKLKFVCAQLAGENTHLRQMLKYQEQSEYAIWWNKVKDIPLM